MADKIQPWISFYLLLLFSLFQASLFSLCFAQLGPPQNIETFYPYPISSPSPSPSPTNNSTQTPPLLSPSSPPPTPSSSDGDDDKIAKAVAATVASTVLLTGLAFLLIKRWIVARRKRKNNGGNSGTNSHLDGGGGGGGIGVRPNSLHSRNEFVRYGGDLKGFIVDENGLDVLYWRKLERRNTKGLREEVLRGNSRRIMNEVGDEDGAGDNDDKRNVMETRGSRRKNKPFQEIPLLRGKSSTSHVKVVPEVNSNEIETASIPPKPSGGIAFKDVQEPELPPTPTPTPPPPQPPLPPPLPPKKAPTPPPPPPRKARSLNSLSKPLPPQKGKPGNREQSSGEAGTCGSGNGRVKLKPLHWDKVNTNLEHAMVWDKINENGSFRFDGDLMEALFGYVATNRKSPKGNKNNTNESKASPSAQIFILEARKSQNIAIVLKSLYVSRKEVIDGLMEGHGLSQETLEKLSRITPTDEEQSQILEYTGDPTRLADAECFLYHVLKAVPSAFTRINAMLYRSNYGPEIVHIKKSIQTLESACEEMRKRGLFVKLLEAILKAGNRMNAGTSRGNAQAFDLTALRKLSDVRSTDGKTTLLHFVVEEVVRSEGKRCVMNRNRSLNSDTYNQTTPAKEDREKEYIMLGLPVVGGLSSEFSNVKKAASIDYDNFSVSCSVLSTKTEEIKKLIAGQSLKGGFGRAMEGFIESTEEELKKMDEEQARVMEVVRKTTEYYQAGASKDKGAHPFQLFFIVKDFLVMVDHVCVEIARNLQRKRGSFGSAASFSPKTPPPPPSRAAVRFENLPDNFLSGRSSSDSDNE